MVERVLAKHKVDGSKPFTRSKFVNKYSSLPLTLHNAGAVKTVL